MREETPMTVLDRVPVDRISAEASQVQFSRVALTVLAAVFYVIGWTAGKVFTMVGWLARALWFGLAWSATAVKVGWVEARAGETRGRPA